MPLTVHPLRARLRRTLLRWFKAPTLYWLRIEATVLTNRLLQGVRLRRPARIKPQARWLNVGCGPQGVAGEDWLNVDARLLPGVDYACDAGRRLPFAGGRFRGVYSEHFFEHLPEGEARRFLAECRRVLAPGGRLRLVVPDGELYLRRYHEDPEWLLQRWPGKFRTPMEVVNRIFRQGSEHQYCYDFATLALWLEEAGFPTVRRCGYRQGDEAELLIDQRFRAVDSLYVEACAPPEPEEG